MWYSGFLLCLLALAACFLPRASAGCSPGDLQQLQQCLAPIHPLLNQPHLPSQKTCRIILGFISCVEKKKRLCLDFIRNTRVLDIAKNLQLKYCVSPWPVTTTVPPPTVHELFSNCREHYSGRNHRTLEEACRWANSFLECGQKVLWSSDFSTDTFQLHAELLRNRAVYLRHCARVALLQGGVGRGRCPYDVTSRMTSCINITYWQPVARGDVKTFCRTVPQFLPCLSDLANGCHHVSLLRDMADFLWNSFDLLSVECSKLGPVHTELDYDYDDYEDEQEEQISSTPDTKSTQLHKAETKPTQLYDAETKPTHLQKTETKPTQLHKAETKSPHLHKAETKPPHLHKAETKPPHLHKAETKPPNLHKTETKPPHLHKAETKPPHLTKAETKPKYLHKTETKIVPESPGLPHIRLSTSERDFKTVTIPSQARGRQQSKLEDERTTTLVQPEQTQSGSFNSNSGEKHEPQNTFQEEKGNRKFVPKSKQEGRETFKETPHTANDFTSQGKSSHGGDQRSECNDNNEKGPECNDAGDKHPKCNGKDDRRRATNGSKQKHNLPPCHSESTNGKDIEYMNAGSDSNHQDNEDSRVGSKKHDQQNEDTRVRSNKHDQQNKDTRVRSNKYDQHNEDSRVGSNKHDQNNEDFRVEFNKHDQHNGDSRVGSSEQNPMGKKQRKQKVRTNGTKQQLLKSSSKNSRRTSFSTKHRPQTSTVVSPSKASSEVVESSPKAFTKPVVSPPEASTKLAGSPSNVSTKHLSRVPLNRQPGASVTTTTLRSQHKSFILRKITAAVTASSPTTPEGPRKTARPTERTSSVSVSLSKGKKMFTRGSVGDFSPASEAVTVEEGVSQEVEEGVSQVVEEGVSQEVEEGVSQEEVEEGVSQEVEEGVSQEEVEEGVSQEEVEEGVSQEVEEGVSQEVEEGVSQEEVEEGVSQEEVEAGVSQEVEEGVSQEEVEAGVNQEEVEAGVNQEEVEEGVSQEEVEEGVSQEEVEEGVSQEVEEGVSQEVEEGVSQEVEEEGVGEEETEEGVNEEDVEEKVSEEEVKEEVIEEEVEEGISQEKLDVLKPTTLQGNRSDPPSNWPSPGPRSPTGRRPADLDKEADAEPGVSPNPAPEGGVVTTLHSRAAPSSLTSTLGGRVSSSITPRSYSSDKSSHPTSPNRYYDDDHKLPTVLTAVAPNRDGRDDSGDVNAPVLAENGKDPKATLAPTATLTVFSAGDSESAGDRTGVRNGEHASRQSEDNKAESLSAESRPKFQSPSSTASTRSPNSSNRQSSLASSTSVPTASKHVHQQEPVSEKAVVLEPNPAQEENLLDPKPTQEEDLLQPKPTQEEDLLEPDPTQEEPNPKRHGPDVTKAVEGDNNSSDKASRSSKDQNGTLSGGVKTADIADNVGLHSVQLPHVTADQRTGMDEDRPTNQETDPMDGGQYLVNSGQRGPRGKELPDSLRGFAPTRLADTEETTVYKPTARPDSKRRPEKRRYDHLNTDGESGNKTERDTDVKLDTKEKPETEEDPGTEVEAGTEAGLDTQPEPGRETEADGQAEADRKGEAETEADRKVAAEKEADRKAAAGTEADRKAAAETEADRKAAAETEADRKAAAETKADRKVAAEKEADRKAAAGTEADRKVAAETEADRKAAAEKEADRKVAAETEADRKAAAETEADRKVAAETEADRRGEAETEAEWGIEQAVERKDGPGAGRPTLATSFSGQPSGGTGEGTGGGTARATPVYHSHDQAPPWGQDCSQPWKGHNWCTSIIMHARLDSPAEECRSLRHYIGCLRGLQRACRQFQPFESISGTVDYITSVFQYKCPAYSVHLQGPA